MASSSTRPKVSVRDGNTNASILANDFRQRVSLKSPGKVSMLKVSRQPLLLASFSDQKKVEITLTGGQQALLQLDQETHILLGREAAHVPDAKRTGSLAAPAGRIHFRIHSVRHQESRFAGSLLEQANHGFVWSQQEAGQPVKTDARPQTLMFSAFGNTLSPGTGKKGKKLIQTPGRVLVQVGMPRRDQRNPKGMGHPKTQDPQVSRPRDMHQIRTKRSELMRSPSFYAGSATDHSTDRGPPETPPGLFLAPAW